MGNPVTVDQLVPMTDELEGKVMALFQLFGAELIGVDFHKRTKPKGNGKKGSRPLNPGEEPDFRSCCVGTKVKVFNKGGVSAYNFKSKGLIHVNLFNEVTRAKLDSHGAVPFDGVIELRHGGFTYHRNNNFEPVATHKFVPVLIKA